MSLYVPDDLKKGVSKYFFSECGEKTACQILFCETEQGDEAADAIVKNYKKNRRCHRQYRIDVKL